MESADKQSRLLAIVESWDLNPAPEFRGFRCAHCQKYLTGSAWHYFLRSGGYKTPVHFCENCKVQFENSTLPAPQRKPVDQKRFPGAISKHAEARLSQISNEPPPMAEPVYKPMICDACGNALPNAEAYHIWQSKNGILMEYHLDRTCGDTILR